MNPDNAQALAIVATLWAEGFLGLCWMARRDALRKRLGLR